MTSELARRIAITIGALLLFRLGNHIPLPGIAMRTDLSSTDILVRLSVFSLALIPCTSAAVIGQPSSEPPTSWRFR